MKFCKVLVSVLLSFLIVSCGNESEEVDRGRQPDNSKVVKLTNEELVSIANDNPTELPESSITDIIEEFRLTKPNDLKQTKSASSIKVSKKYYINRNGEKGSQTKSLSGDNSSTLSIPIYEVELDDSGLAYVSTDSRFASVLAYIPKKAGVEEEGKTAKQILLGMSEEAALNYVTKVEKLKDSLRTQTLVKIGEELSLDLNEVNFEGVKDYLVLDEERTTKAKPIGSTPGQSYGEIGPLVRVSWDQNYPFSLGLPQNPNFPFPTMRYPVGCAVVAMGQAITAVQPAPSMTIEGTRLDWNEMLRYSRPLEGSTAEKHIALLMKNIYYETGTETTWETKFGSSNTSPSRMLPYLRKYINADDIEKFNLDKLLSSFNLGRAALMYGYADDTSAAHGWVCDGYKLCKKMSRQLVQQYDVYYHANLGWNNSDTGYYLIASNVTLSFQTSEGTFANSVYQICNLRAK